ncbi:hypothetical protein [Bosea sp. 685]|uniref:hypothetical protein n=1 Tax=Bosea sp. 685 TaxID=3080057 RepID=UPI00289349CA|nr:hypothetical protein [Bosea sp. 685]WNJ88387.1 hypothetical protein RMR04_18430 [Bosea sp. 685]
MPGKVAEMERTFIMARQAVPEFAVERLDPIGCTPALDILSPVGACAYDRDAPPPNMLPNRSANLRVTAGERYYFSGG